MPRTRRTKPELTESWADVDEDHPSAGSISSDDDVPPPTKSTDAKLSASQANHLHDALENGDRTTPLRAQSGNMRISRTSLTNSTTGLAKSGVTQSARKRTNRSARQSAEPEFIMPSVGDADNTPRSPRYGSRGSMHQSQARLDRLAAQSKGRQSTSEEEDVPSQYPTVLWSHFVLPFLQYIYSVIGLAFGYTKPLVAYALVIWLLVGGLILASNFLTSSITTALTPLCRIPGASYLPFCTDSTAHPAPGVAEFSDLITAQSAFEDVLTASAGGASLPLAMKHSESSIRDLRHVVQYSTLPSRNELVFEFEGFITTARTASADLQKYNSRIGRAVDRILTTNRWTLQVLDGLASDAASRGALSTFLGNINPLSPFLPTAKMSDTVVFDQYIRHTSAIEDEIAALILEAQALLQVLQNLDDRLDIIASISTRDGVKASEDRDELFSTLWVKLGGKRSSVAKVENQLAILKDVGNYRKMAWAHVSGTVVKLQAIAAQLEDLRERVAEPEVLGRREEVPLEMHIRQISMGVERLESVRQEGRLVGEQRVRAVLDRGEERGIDGA
ncbi:hypothetical protein M8818_005105 [Zalaria obscura]|uniref:Uncharacterized protein n=1 Tax=Zalaria obscura TaxID=2024903 RepID=A0ACC3SCX8_9PEZI